MNRGGTIRTCKTNFWSTLRVDRGIKLKELADLLGFSDSAVGAWFSGQVLPKASVINDLCSFFDVDVDEGTRQFVLAHREWRAQNNRPSATKNIPATREKSLDSISTSDDILQLLYGKVDYTTFVRLTTVLSNKSDDTDVLQEIYGSVSYEEFCLITDFIRKETYNDKE